MNHVNTSALRARRINRRTFTAGALALAAAPFTARAQQQPARRKLVALLSADTRELAAGRVGEFLRMLRGYGWTEGQQFDFVQRYADGRSDRIPALAAELAALKPDVILSGSTTAVLAAREQIGTIATVAANGSGQLVERGLAQSYRRPGGNFTGVGGQSDEGIDSKRLQLIQEAMHGAARIGLLLNPDAPSNRLSRPEIEAAAVTLGVTLVTVEARRPEDFEAAFAILARERVAAVYVVNDVVSYAARDRIAALELAAKLPAIHHFAEEAQAGSLMAYGSSNTDNFRRAAFLVHKVLSGTPPAELPIDVQPNISLTINLKTAKALGLALPESILLRATEFIE